MLDVSIIFVNYKTKDFTIDAIKSVFDKTQGIDFEIFVVDNNSQDGSIEAIEKEFPNINIIKNPINAGFGAANNLAIKQAKGKYILCLNTDTILVNNAIKIMYDFMEEEENKNVAVCGAALYNSDGKPATSAGNSPSLQDVFWKFGFRDIFKKQYLKYKIVLNHEEIDCSKNVDYISGADIFFRKSVLEQVGLFDEKFFMYYEETDLCKRIRDKNYVIKLCDKAKIIHLENQSCINTLRRKRLIKRSEFYYFKKHKPYQLVLIKVLYMFLYFCDWVFLKNYDSKELLTYIFNLNIKGFKYVEDN